MEITKRINKGIIAIVIAMIIFAIGCNDSVELVGTYRLYKSGGEKISEQLKERDLKKNDIKQYTTYKMFGGVGAKIKYSKNAMEELKMEKDDVKEINDEIKEEAKDTRWFIKDNQLMTRDKEDSKSDVERGSAYKTGFTSLYLGSEQYKRTFFGYICPSVILKVAALAILAYGISELMGKDDKKRFNNIEKGILTAIIAAIIFTVGCFDRIEVIGNYKVYKINGEKISEQFEDEDLKAKDVKMYVTYNMFGGMKSKTKLSKDAKEALGDSMVESIEEADEESKDKKWFLTSMLMTRDKDDEKKDASGVIYESGFGKLETGRGDSKTIYKRTFFGYICPSVIIKVASLAVLAYGILLVLKKNEEEDAAFAGDAVLQAENGFCAACGGAVNPEDKFCENCGAAIESAVAVEAEAAEEAQVAEEVAEEAAEETVEAEEPVGE